MMYLLLCVSHIELYIWHARRKVIHEAIYESPLSTLEFVRSFLDKLRLCTKEVKVISHAETTPVH